MMEEKKIKGRKRHILVDTQGLIMHVHVTEANVNDRDGLLSITEKIKNKFKKLLKIWADMGYQGKEYAKKIQDYGRNLEIVKRPSKRFWVPYNIEDVESYLAGRGIDISTGFKVLPKRWIVERTFGWLNKYRRLSKDYEYNTDSSEGMILLAMIRRNVKKVSKIKS